LQPVACRQCAACRAICSPSPVGNAQPVGQFAARRLIAAFDFVHSAPVNLVHSGRSHAGPPRPAPPPRAAPFTQRAGRVASGLRLTYQIFSFILVRRSAAPNSQRRVAQHGRRPSLTQSHSRLSRGRPTCQSVCAPKLTPPHTTGTPCGHDRLVAASKAPPPSRRGIARAGVVGFIHHTCTLLAPS